MINSNGHNSFTVNILIYFHGYGQIINVIKNTVII